MSGRPLVLPLIQEQLDIQTRKEELHLTTRWVETHAPQCVMLRREETVIERSDREGNQRDIE
jgi:hypothetical protein